MWFRNELFFCNICCDKKAFLKSMQYQRFEGQKTKKYKNFNAFGQFGTKCAVYKS